MSESKSASVVFTNGRLLAKNAQKTADNAKSAAEEAQALASGAQKTADGKNSVYRGSDPSTVPTAGLKEGDIYFTATALYTWNGSAWEKTVSDTTGAEIHAKVEAAMQESQKSVADLKSNVEAKVKNLDDEIAKNKIQTGNALSFYKEQYYLSTSYTELTGGSWSDEVPPRKVEGKYVWSRYVTANVGDPTNQQYSDPVCISGLDGKDGEQGPQGPQGVPGPKGADGQTTYVHVAYANSADGSADFSVNYFPDALYIGVLTDYTQADSTDYTQYTWSRLKGDTGDQGSPGPKGADGRTTYVHFAYANIVQLGQERISPNFTLSTQTVVRFGDEASERWVYKNLPAGKYTVNTATFDGSDPALWIYKVVQSFSDFSVTESSGRAYIGQYTDYTQADSTDPASYRWTKIKGETGPTGATGPKGDTGDTGFFIGTTPPPNPTKGTVWATNDSSGNMTSAKTWDGSNWVSTAFTQDLVAGNISATKIVGGELDVNKITIKNAQNIPVTSTVSLGDKLSNIEQDANKITSTLRDGGRNLLSNTRDLDDPSIWGNLWAWDKGDFYNDGRIVQTSSQQWNGLKQYVYVEAGKKYTFSIDAKSGDNSNHSAYFFATLPSAQEGQYNRADVIGDAQIFTYTPTWTRYSFTITATTDGYVAPRIERGTTTNELLQLARPQFECGEIATPWQPSNGDISTIQQTAKSLNAYVKGSNGSKTLEAILSMDPDHSSIAQVVNGQIAAAIGTYSDGSVRIDGKVLHINAQTKIDDATIKSAMIDSIEADKITTGTLNADHVRVINLDASSITTGRISGKNIELDGNTTVTGRLDLMRKDSNSVTQSTNYHNNWSWQNAHIYFDNYLQLQGENCDVFYTDTKTHLGGTSNFYSITTLTPGYLKFTTYKNKIGDDDENFDGQISRSYLDSGRLETPEVHTDKIALVGYKIKSGDGGSLYVSNKEGGNFDGGGSVGFQVWGGIGLGKNTMYMPSSDLYIQQGNVGPAFGQSYSDAGKVDVHCNRVISQRANTVSSRLSVKTDITPVSYDRALAAVEGTDMYDYRYVSDDSGQHYVSGIIDDVNPDPQYHMDDMLINKERTARIDANLVGYHHVVIQKLLERVAALEEKVK